jgi:hypothetical protein
MKSRQKLQLLRPALILLGYVSDANKDLKPASGVGGLRPLKPCRHLSLHGPYISGLVFIIFCGLSFMLPAHVRGEFYKYTDDQGQVYFVDDLSKVPSQYRNQINIYQERYDHLPADERAALIETERQIEEELELDRQRQLQLIIEQARALEEEEKQREAQEAYRRKMQTKVVIDGNRILVPVKLGNAGSEIDAMFLLDTGASHTVVFRSLADQLRIATLKRVFSKVAGGRQIQSQLGELSYLKIGPITMKNTKVLIIVHDGPPLKYSGLVGMNFLRNFQYSIDYQKQVIRWLPQQN